jgi:hypothetical protein
METPMTPAEYLRDGHAPFSAELREKMGEIRSKLSDLAERGNPDPEQVKRYVAGLEKLIEAGAAETAERTAQLSARAQNPANLEHADSRSTPPIAAGNFDGNPLDVTSFALDAIEDLLQKRDSGRVLGRLEERSALAVATTGARRHWAANSLRGPRLLHTAAGMPQSTGIQAVSAQHPILVLPTAEAGVNENTTLAEYDDSTAGTVTLKRFGRFTDLSTEANIAAGADAYVSIHRVGIARDLDAVLVNALETAAGAAQAFGGDDPAAVRQAMALVLDNTAAASASDLVIIVNPNDAPVLQDVTPTGGQTIAESFQNFSGALVYPSSAMTEGAALVANLRTGARYFEARGLTTETDLDAKTGTLTLATNVIAGYGLTFNGGTTGAYIAVEVAAGS